MKKHNVIKLLCLSLLLITAMGCSLKTNEQDNAKKTSSDTVDYKDLSDKITSQSGNIILLTDNEDSKEFLSVKKGLEGIEKRMPLSAVCQTYKDDEELKKQVDKVVDDENSLIWIVGKKADDIKDIAKDNEEVTFAVIDDEADKKEDNIFTFRFKEEEAGFLAGYLAVLDSKSDKVGILCDNDDKRDISGFKAGVIYAGDETGKSPKTKIIKASNDKMKEEIKKAYESEIDILYVNDSKYNEVAMKEAKKFGKYVIAFNDKENSFSKKTLLADLKYELDSAIEIATFDILKANKLENSYEYGFSEGAINIDLCQNNINKFLTVSKVNALKETLLTDSIKIPKNEKELKNFKKGLK